MLSICAVVGTLFMASTNNVFAAKEFTVYALDGDGNWIAVTVSCGENSWIKDGILYMYPPWKITYPNGSNSSGNNGQGITWLPPIAKVVFSDNRELELSSENLFTSAVLKLTGEVIYSAKNVNDITIDLKSILPAEGNYIFLLEDKELNRKFMKILFSNDSIFIGAPFVFDPNK